MARRTAASLKPPALGRPSPKRDALLDAAEALFDRYGFHATGIDRLIAEADVARMTFYKHFPTKAALVRGVIERRDDRFWQAMTDGVETRLAAGETDPIVATFAALGEWLETHAAQSCLLSRAIAEFAGHDVELAGDAAFRKKKVPLWFADLLTRHGLSAGEDAVVLGETLAVILEGAMTLAPILGGATAAERAGIAALALVKGA